MSNPIEPSEIDRINSSLKIMNFDPSWEKPLLEDIFSSYGIIESCHLMKKYDIMGIEKPFALICYDWADGGPASAKKAI